MKKEKGFTLIELLAVIVILAVIALIAVPQVLNILSKARKSAAEDTTYGIIKAAESYATNFMLTNNGNMPSEDLVFECSKENNGCKLTTTLTGYNLTDLDMLDFKGTKPTSGRITIKNNGKNISVSDLVINDFTCTHENDVAKCSEGGSTTTTTTTTKVVSKACSVTSGDGTNIGDEITCGTESFYVLENNGTNIRMLTKYNLNVGNNKVESDIEEIQSVNATGYVFGISAPYPAVVVFSSDNYWYDSTNSSLKTEYGTTYPAFVYDSNSNLYTYVENYVSYLQNSLNIIEASGSLIKKEEVETLKSSGYTWIYSTSYLTGTAGGNYGVWFVDSDGRVNSVEFSTDYVFGVRPVITISASNI